MSICQDSGPFVTPRLSVVNTDGQSILPTGSIKVVNGVLLQEVEIIVHRTQLGSRGPGLYIDWIAFSARQMLDLQRLVKVTNVV